jgi:hypothetical protein
MDICGPDRAIYCAVTCGFVLGFGLGWIPALILALLVVVATIFLWPLAAVDLGVHPELMIYIAAFVGIIAIAMILVVAYREQQVLKLQRLAPLILGREHCQAQQNAAIDHTTFSTGQQLGILMVGGDWLASTIVQARTKPSVQEKCRFGMLCCPRDAETRRIRIIRQPSSSRAFKFHPLMVRVPRCHQATA